MVDSPCFAAAEITSYAAGSGDVEVFLLDRLGPSMCRLDIQRQVRERNSRRYNELHTFCSQL